MPGIGRKSAQRIAWQLLQRDREGGRHLAGIMAQAMERIGHCRQCRTFSEQECCAICRNPDRDVRMICVVESPADVYAMEQTQYRGTYFVLLGHLSPLDGIGPEALGLEHLEARLRQGLCKELILATNTTVEGEATAHFITGLAHREGVRVTRIARGVPMGGELEYSGSDTLARALSERSEV